MKDQQAKLLEAHYQGAVPIDLLKVEMDRLARERANAETELKLATTTLVELDSQLERILAVAGNCQAQYLSAPPAIRRQINQGLFVKLFISQDGNVERVELTEPFATLLGTDQAAPPEITAEVDDERSPTTSQNVQDAQTDGEAMEDTTGEAETPRDAQRQSGRRSPSVGGVGDDVWAGQEHQASRDDLLGRWFERR